MKPDVKSIRARAEAATKGEWRVSSTGYSVKSATDDMPIVASNPWGSAMRESQAEKWLDNAEFIAAARTDVPALCDRVEALERALADLVDWNRHRYPLQMGGNTFPPSLTPLMDAAARALGDSE